MIYLVIGVLFLMLIVALRAGLSKADEINQNQELEVDLTGLVEERKEDD